MRSHTAWNREPQAGDTVQVQNGLNVRYWRIADVGPILGE